MQSGADDDVITVLTTDHREVEQVITELVRHAVAEEAYLYPATRRLVPGGDELADHELAEHAQAERTMKELKASRPRTPASTRSLTSWCRRSPSTSARRSRSCSRS